MGRGVRAAAAAMMAAALLAALVATPVAAHRPLLEPGEAGTTAVRQPFGYRAKGMTHEVVAFLKTTDLDWALQSLDLDAVSTIAYFAVSADRYGRISRRLPDGRLTRGWAGWQSSDMTEIIRRAHARGTKVVLTLERFAWDDAGRAETSALLGSATARRRLAAELADAVVARGVDGINIDIEPVPSTRRAEFVSFVREVRSALEAKGPGYQLVFDATGYVASYDITGATAAGAAHAVYIMAYQYRGANTSTAGSTAPLTGRAYDVSDTLDRYLSLTSASKIILGTPLYGYRWPTASGEVHASTTGTGRTVLYDQAATLASRYGLRWDPVEQTAWTRWTERACTTCPERWHQLYFDDVRSLRAKYDDAVRRGLRGVGLWAMGYQGTRTGVTRLLEDRFLSGG